MHSKLQHITQNDPGEFKYRTPKCPNKNGLVNDSDFYVIKQNMLEDKDNIDYCKLKMSL